MMIGTPSREPLPLGHVLGKLKWRKMIIIKGPFIIYCWIFGVQNIDFGQNFRTYFTFIEILSTSTTSFV